MWWTDKYSYISGGEKKKKAHIKNQLKYYRKYRLKSKWLDFTGWILSYVSVWRDERYSGNDEFHKSLDMSPYIHYMSEVRRKRYLKRLTKRRQEIHERTL